MEAPDPTLAPHHIREGELALVGRAADDSPPPSEAKAVLPDAPVVPVNLNPAADATDSPTDPAKPESVTSEQFQAAAADDTPESSLEVDGGHANDATAASTPASSVPATFHQPPSTASTPVPEETSLAQFASRQLPPGVTEDSPSVRRESIAVQAYLANPSEPSPLIALITSATAQNELDDARAWYEAFLRLFPTAAPQYLSYVELELAHDNQKQVEALFSRAFAKTAASGPVFPLAYPPLWTAYLHYIRRQNPLPPVPPSVSALPSSYLSTRLVITKAYEFALTHVGFDSSSTPIWKEYIHFIREGETRTTWEEQGKVAELRKVYTRVLKIPVEDVEGIWREYDAFEGMVNKVTAKKFLAERSPAYMTARSALKDLRSKLPATASAFPAPLPQRPTWTDQDRSLVAAWKAYLEWEASNPIELEDAEELQARVMYAYRKAVSGDCRFFPEIWFFASKYCSSLSKTEDAAGYLRSGLHVNPSSFLLAFALAELEEARKNFAECHSVFSALLAQTLQNLDAAKLAASTEVASALSSLNESFGSQAVLDPSDIDTADLKREQDEKRRSVESSARQKHATEISELDKAVALVWIMHMRFARRSEGIKSCRSIFSKARKSGQLAWQVFEASALIEYHCSKDASVATRIFELGLKIFGDKIEFVDKYLSFLITVNDNQNARVLFEKSVTKFSPEVARQLWERWARYEYLFGDLSSAQRLDQRFTEVFPSDTATKNFARRHSYTGIDEIARIDLGLGFSSQRAMPPAPPQSYFSAPPPAPAVVTSSAVTASPTVKRTLPVEPASRHTPESEVRSARQRSTSIERGDRPSMRQQPPKRMRPSSPPAPSGRRGPDSGWASRGGGREVTPPTAPRRDRSPPRDVRPPISAPPTKELSLHAFLGLLPPAGTFNGPLLQADDVLRLLGQSSVVPRMPAPGGEIVERGGRRRGGRGR